MIQPTPYYLADPNVFISNSERLTQVIKAYYSNYNLSYSFKTNYYDGFLRTAKAIGLLAEVVSVHEYELAKSCGFTEKDIIWNGVLPSEVKLSVIENGGIVNVDNFTELYNLMEVWFENHHEPLPIGLRFEIPQLTNGKSRFGFHESDFDEFGSIINANKINVRCVHSHTSNARDLGSFKQRIEYMVNLARMFNSKIVDIGGNMYGPMHPDFARQYDSSIPSLEDYGMVIGKKMKELVPNEDIILVTENGTALVGNAMDLVAKVIKRNDTKGAVRFTLNCNCYDVGFSCNHKNPVIETSSDSSDVENAVIYGCTCLERDIIHRCFSGKMDVGDIVTIKNVGAYSLNVSNNFISPVPYIVNK
ncbi:MAG: hypothetical protein HDS62_08460 [Bacteroidales bacterium]|nr:hypothetical protein [Bacteroidales bacterium]